MRKPGNQSYQVWQKIRQQRLSALIEQHKDSAEQDPDESERLFNLIEKYQESRSDFAQLIGEIVRLAEHNPGAHLSMMENLYHLQRSIHRLLTETFHLTEDQLSELDKAYQADSEARAKERERMNNLETMPYSMYLKTPHWQEMRLGALRRARNRCELCNNTRWLDVHHKTYERRGHELESDLIVLCRNCHEKFHDKLPNHPDNA